MMQSGENRVRLSMYDNRGFNPGASFVKRALWYMVNAVFFDSYLLTNHAVKSALLVLFGGSVGKGVVIKPKVKIKYPWNLTVGDNVWIGEGAWIDNLVKVAIGDDVCVSQGACVMTGSHDYKKPAFDLIVKPVIIGDGAWIGAKAIVCPGVTVGSHGVVTAGSVLTTDALPYTVYQGNPAAAKRMREISGAAL